MEINKRMYLSAACLYFYYQHNYISLNITGKITQGKYEVVLYLLRDTGDLWN